MNAAPSLPELQRRFADALLGSADTVPTDWIAGNGLGADARVQIYRNLVRNNHAATLRTAYPAVLKLVGEDFFETAAARYLRANGSSSGNLQDYGAAFPAFLAHMPEAASLAYLPDVAWLEWARQESYLAADAEPLDSTVLADLPEAGIAELKTTPHPSVRLVVSAHPIFDIWLFCQQTAPERLNLSGTGQTVLIWREECQLAMQPLVHGQSEFIGALLTGETLASAHAHALTAEPGFDLITGLRWLVQTGLITGLSNH
ncbi:MAG: putative DNA-binding domain-containing protein [Gammaproteobacteria bacterium]|nr:putative DNA-binding domain-containing protein [Gammaproteobacteria bacterium]